jgi:predicted amidohydrolase YtcJ
MHAMTIRSLAAAAAVATALAVSACARETQPPADIVVMHGSVHTGKLAAPRAEAVAVRDGRIVAVGSNEEIEAYRGPSTTTLDAQQRTVMAGFTDPHVHFTQGAARMRQVSLDDARTVAEYQKRIADYAAANPSARWIEGGGWTYPVFGASGLPDKRYIDEVVVDRPVALMDYNFHTMWVNSKALELAGITRRTADPPNGTIEKNPRSGEPTGVLKESAADLVRRVVPAPTRDEQLDTLRRGIQHANSVGLVRVHSAGTDTEALPLLDELRRQNQLTLRFSVATQVQPPRLTPEALDTMEERRRTYNDDWIDAARIKFLADGLIETHTAAMLEPYSDDPKQKGGMMFEPAEYRKAVLELDRRGFQIFTHAIGDAMIRLALDTYEETARANGTKDARHRIEHIENPSQQDIARFGPLNVVASMQALHAVPNDSMLNVWSRNVGAERVQRAFPWRSIAAGGGRLAFSSDWPVVTLNPWPAVEFLLTRQASDRTPAGGWSPSERITIAEALHGYTLAAAYAGKRDATEGSIEPNKVADLIILSQDPFQVDTYEIGKTQVLLTMVGGKVVYQAAAAAPMMTSTPTSTAR